MIFLKFRWENQCLMLKGKENTENAYLMTNVKRLKKADRERKALKRATEKLAMDQLTKRRECDRERQRKHREPKSMNKPTVINMSFKSRQSKARAVTKARRALPSTPKKTREVVRVIQVTYTFIARAN